MPVSALCRMLALMGVVSFVFWILHLNAEKHTHTAKVQSICLVLNPIMPALAHTFA